MREGADPGYSDWEAEDLWKLPSKERTVTSFRAGGDSGEGARRGDAVSLVKGEIGAAILAIGDERVSIYVPICWRLWKSNENDS